MTQAARSGVTLAEAAVSRHATFIDRAVPPRVGGDVRLVTQRETQVAADAIRDTGPVRVGVPDPGELDTALATLAGDRPGALLVLSDLMLQAHRRRIVDFVARIRLAAVYERKEWAQAGGLMSYGVSIPKTSSAPPHCGQDLQRRQARLDSV